MSRTLLLVARVNNMDPAHRDFRHGSIHSRVQAMQRLIGCPIDDLPVDRGVRRLKVLGLAGSVALVVLTALTA